jgi:hypothetical protein
MVLRIACALRSRYAQHDKQNIVILNDVKDLLLKDC